MTVKVLISSSHAGFPYLTRDGMKALYAAHPELFGHPHDLVDFKDQLPEAGCAHDNVEDEYPDCFAEDGKVYFMQMNAPEFRTCSWLLQTYEAGRLEAFFKGPRSAPVKLKVLEIPSDVTWDVREADDGTEYVCERARVWS